MSSNGNSVYLWIEKVSANSFSSLIHHTSICVEFENGLRYMFSYNEHGLRSSPMVETPKDVNEVKLGYTTKTLSEIMEKTEKMEKRCGYSLMSRNCNHFADELSYFLCGKGIPEESKSQTLKFVEKIIAAFRSKKC